WVARPPPSRGAQSSRDRGSDPARDLAAQARRRRSARRPSAAPVRKQGLALCAGARHRRADRDPVRDLAAFHHGSGRHAFLRPRRLFWPRRLWRGADGEVFGGADPGRTHGRAARGAHGRVAVRLVRGAALRRLPRDAHACLRADRVVDPVPVGGRHRRVLPHSPRLAATAGPPPSGPLSPVPRRPAFFLPALAIVVAGVLILRRVLFAPFGYAMRAGRDSALRAEAIGINVKRVHWIGFAIAGTFAGIAGGTFAFAKGTISPDVAW